MSVRCRLCLHNYHSRCWGKSGGCTTWGCAGKPVFEEKSQQPRYKRCPYCGEDILDFAIKCRYCRSALVQDNITPKVNQLRVKKEAGLRKDPILACLLNLVFPGAGYMYLGKMMQGLIWFLIAIASVFIARPLGPVIVYLWLMYDSTRQALRHNHAYYSTTKNKSLQ